MKLYRLFWCFLVVTLTSCTTTVIEEAVVNETVTYEGQVRSIVTNNCTTSCHNPSSLDGGLNLTTFSGMRDATENGNVLSRINNATNPMPVGGQMPPILIATIEQWAAQGFLEN